MSDLKPYKLSLQQRKGFAAGQLFLVESDGSLVEITDNDWSFINPNVPSEPCRCCLRILPLTCFRGGWDSHVSRRGESRHPDCVICEFLAQEAYRQEHLWEHAAEQRIRDHMTRERKQGLHACTTLEDYMRLTGVTISWLARKMEVAWETDDVCSHCETAGLPAHWRQIVPDPYGDYRQLERMTIDRTDPKRLLARDNLTLMCRPGNVAKSKTPPDIYNDRQAYWRHHNYAMRDRENNGSAGGAPGA